MWYGAHCPSFHGRNSRRAISEAISRAARSVGDVNSQPYLSATPARWTGSGSGSVNTVIHLIDAGQPNLAAGQ